MPRFSRISWKSRDDAEPPRMASRSEAAAIRPRDARRTDADVVLLRVLAREAQARRWSLDERRANPAAPGGSLLHLPLGPLEEPEQLARIEVSRRRDDDVPRHVHGAVVGGNRPAGHGGDHVGRADHGPA